MKTNHWTNLCFTNLPKLLFHAKDKRWKKRGEYAIVIDKNAIPTHADLRRVYVVAATIYCMAELTLCLCPFNLSISSHFVQMWFYLAIYAHFAEFFFLLFCLLLLLESVACFAFASRMHRTISSQRHLHNTNRLQVAIVWRLQPAYYMVPTPCAARVSKLNLHCSITNQQLYMNVLILLFCVLFCAVFFSLSCLFMLVFLNEVLTIAIFIVCAIRSYDVRFECRKKNYWRNSGVSEQTHADDRLENEFGKKILHFIAIRSCGYKLILFDFHLFWSWMNRTMVANSSCYSSLLYRDSKLCYRCYIAANMFC